MAARRASILLRTGPLRQWIRGYRDQGRVLRYYWTLQAVRYGVPRALSASQG